MSTIIGPPTRRHHPTWSDVNALSDLDDSLADAIEQRVADLERALVDWRHRRRLRRQVRRDDRLWRRVAPDFADRRVEITTAAWLNRPRRGQS